MTTKEALLNRKKRKKKVFSMILQTVRELYYPAPVGTQKEYFFPCIFVDVQYFVILLKSFLFPLLINN